LESSAPSGEPTASPTGGPTGSPTDAPTASPTGAPTNIPTTGPTGAPTGNTLGSISGVVKEDIDNDDQGDEPISDILIQLKDETGAIVATTTTGSDGFYVFYDVPAGVYFVMEINSDLVPLDVADSQGFPMDNIVEVVLGAAENSTQNDFTDEKKRVVAGQVLEDEDNDEDGDSPIEGVLVTLVSAINGTVIATTLTDTGGSFMFMVEPGIYALIEENLSGFADVMDSDGGNPNVIEIVDVEREDVLDNEFVDELESSAPSGEPSASPIVDDTPIPTAAPAGLATSLPTQRPTFTTPAPSICFECVRLDFERSDNGTNLAVGEFVSDQWLNDFGLTISAEGMGSTGFTPDGQARIFDTSNPTGSDDDLGTPNSEFGGPGVGDSGSPSNDVALGKVLIIQESDQAEPDDSEFGGVISFAFVEPVKIEDVVLLDIESSGGTITVTTSTGSSSSQPVLPGGDNSVQTEIVMVEDVVKMDVMFPSSGAVAEVGLCVRCFRPTPQPAIETPRPTVGPAASTPRPTPRSTPRPTPRPTPRSGPNSPFIFPDRRLGSKRTSPVLEHMPKHTVTDSGCAGAKATNIQGVAVDKCIATGMSEIPPASIVSQDGELVTVALTQSWKGCDVEDAFGTVSWIAVDFINHNGELECRKYESVGCGEDAGTITLQCQDGASVLDLFLFDDGDDATATFGQTDRSQVRIPNACDTVADRTKMCHKRYIVHCRGSIDCE